MQGKEMTDETKLGELEFKAEDFLFDNVYGDSAELVATACADVANKILREKLAKAPAVYGSMEGTTCSWRLVCIEEIKK